MGAQNLLHSLGRWGRAGGEGVSTSQWAWPAPWYTPFHWQGVVAWHHLRARETKISSSWVRIQLLVTILNIKVEAWIFGDQLVSVIEFTLHLIQASVCICTWIHISQRIIYIFSNHISLWQKAMCFISQAIYKTLKLIQIYNYLINPFPQFRLKNMFTSVVDSVIGLDSPCLHRIDFCSSTEGICPLVPSFWAQPCSFFG